MQTFRRIGILTSGGDAPGMNAVIRAIARKANKQGVEAVGIIGGYNGLINKKLIPLTTSAVSNIITRGGTMLYSDRCLEFKTEEGMQKAIETCKSNDIDAIVAIGGDGTFRGATDLAIRGIPTIGVTGTIDNDITATEYTVGFDTAMNTVVEVLDKLRDTCESHARCNVVEVMGRNCGQIALRAGIAAGAMAVAIPEIPFDEEATINRIKAAKRKAKRGMLIVVSEGVFATDENGNKVPYGEVLKKKIQEQTGIETKFARLAHIVRGGTPTLRDRLTASQMGVKAIDLILEGKSNLVVVEEDSKIESMDIVFALTADRMYKNKLMAGDLDKFSAEDIAKMEAICEKRRQEIANLYAIINDLAL
ncbi:MAG: 6-phosphofructokinase [Clostridia bacterium]|nr:6-phosphofructokinase [Clostridia bacterium]MBQ8331745.1 6-phosphofructokinase [Clostridia bacterium]